MKRASEYREHAEECRKLGASLEGEQRDQLLRMAENWERLARERAEFVQRHPESASAEGPSEG